MTTLASSVIACDYLPDVHRVEWEFLRESRCGLARVGPSTWSVAMPMSYCVDAERGVVRTTATRIRERTRMKVVVALMVMGLTGCGAEIPLDAPLIRLSGLTRAHIEALSCERTAVRPWQRPLRWEQDCAGFPDDAYVAVHLDWRGHITQVVRTWEVSGAGRAGTLQDSVRKALVGGKEARLCQVLDDGSSSHRELWRVSRYVLELSEQTLADSGTTERRHEVRAALSEAPVAPGCRESSAAGA